MAVFGKKPKDLMESHIATIISDGCHIDGNIKSDSSIKIDGVINGNVDAKQGVILGDTGKITGHVNAHEAVIFGQVLGNIHTHKLEIKSTGKVNGDIRTETIEMEFGAVYNGKVSMQQGASSSTNTKVQQNGILEEVN